MLVLVYLLLAPYSSLRLLATRPVLLAACLVVAAGLALCARATRDKQCEADERRPQLGARA